MPWNFEERQKPTKVVARKLLTISVPYDWDEDQVLKALGDFEKLFTQNLGTLGSMSGVSLIIERAPETSTRKRRRL